MAKQKSSKEKQSNSRTDYKNFQTVLFYCIIIIILPIITFFVSKTFVFDVYFDLTPVKSNIFSAVLTIIALHVALGLYIYRAYFDSEQKKID